MATFSPFYKIRIFTFDDVMNETGLSRAGTSTALARWQMQGLLKPVRRNLYVAINPSSDTPIADKYELCSRISATSYVGWHTALEFHGVAHQPFYNAYVGSKTRFNQFSFYGTDYEYCAAPLEPTEANGIIRPLGNPYVRAHLMPVLSRKEKFDFNTIKSEVMSFLDEFLVFSENEYKFIEHFNRREYRPDILFGEGEISKRIASHPMALWKCRPKEQ